MHIELSVVLAGHANVTRAELHLSPSKSSDHSTVVKVFLSKIYDKSKGDRLGQVADD